MSTAREILPTNVTPLHYDLSFEPDFKTFKFAGSAAIDLRINDPANDTLTLNSLQLEYQSVTLDGIEASEVSTDDNSKQRVKVRVPHWYRCRL